MRRGHHRPQSFGLGSPSNVSVGQKTLTQMFAKSAVPKQAVQPKEFLILDDDTDDDDDAFSVSIA